MVLNIAMGGAAGLLCAVGGAVKDAPHEGFKPVTFLRSPAVGLAVGAVTSLWTHHPIIAFCCAGYMERFVVEGWKILRCQKPGKFSWSTAEWPWLWAGEKPLDRSGKDARD